MVAVAAYISLPGPADSGRSVDAAFGLLRTHQELPRSPADWRSLASATAVEPHAQFANRQLVRGRASLWVLSSGRSMCISQPKAASCAPTEVAEREGVFLGTFTPPTKRRPFPHDFLLQGIVPDGVRQVKLVVGESKQLVANVRGNVISVRRAEPVHVKRLLPGPS